MLEPAAARTEQRPVRTERLAGNLGGFASMMPGGFMVRRWFYVVDTGDHWEVRAHDATPARPGLRYSLQEDGIQAATQLARAEWRLSHEPTGVRVQTPMGGWEAVRTFGDDPADAVA